MQKNASLPRSTSLDSRYGMTGMVLILTSSERRSASTKHCYKDVCLWIVRNPRYKEKDVFVIEIYFKYQGHKIIDNKPKSYVAPYQSFNPG